LKWWATLEDRVLWSSAVEDVAACLELLTAKEETNQPTAGSAKRKPQESSASKARTKKAKVT